MKILVLTPGVLPDTFSGIGTNVFYLSRQLRRMGHEIVLLTRRFHPEHLPEEVIEGMSYFRVPHPKRYGLFHKLWPLTVSWQSRRWQKRIRRAFPEIDVIYVQNPLWTLFLNPKRLWPAAKVVFHFHCDPYSELIANNGTSLPIRLIARFYDEVEKRGMRKADRILVHSKFTREIALRMMGDSIQEKLMTVPGAADTDLYRPAGLEEKTELKKKFGLPTDRPVFMTARGLKGRTGVDKLVAAASILKREGHPFFLVVVGKGPMKPKIQELVQKENLEESVRMISDLSEEELARHYQASDVFVLPSQEAEGFGLATVEALSSGLPVLGTNNGATPEILNLYHRDWLIEGRDAQSIFRKMRDYCLRPDRFFVPGERIVEITKQHFTWPIAAGKFVGGIKNGHRKDSSEVR